MTDTDWVPQLLLARDFFEPHTLTAHEWLSREPEQGRRTEMWEEFLSASAAARSRPGYSELRQEPRVAYDVINDCAFFFFKMENNGDTLVVSRKGLPGLGRLILG